MLTVDTSVVLIFKGVILQLSLIRQVLPATSGCKVGSGKSPDGRHKGCGWPLAGAFLSGADFQVLTAVLVELIFEMVRTSMLFG